ncbi:MAG: hypothetical protein JWL61_5052 [Gemmatimonadetes bacterium]|nr:hypothetical protein [Gemmatimonadota bacterium]
MTVVVLVTLVLWLLAAYHIVTGAVALFAPDLAPRVVGSLYGATVASGGQVRYMTSMIGALALAIGGLAVVAAQRPYANRPIIAMLIVLQLCRVFCRVRDRRVLAESFGVNARANAAAIAVLVAESAVLTLGLR